MRGGDAVLGSSKPLIHSCERLEVTAWVIATLSTASSLNTFCQGWRHHPRWDRLLVLSHTAVLSPTLWLTARQTSLPWLSICWTTACSPLLGSKQRHNWLPLPCEILAEPRDCGTASHCTARLIANTGREQWERLWKAACVQWWLFGAGELSPPYLCSPLPGGKKNCSWDLTPN